MCLQDSSRLFLHHCVIHTSPLVIDRCNSNQTKCEQHGRGSCDVPEHGHGEPLREHVHDERPQRVQAGQLVGQVHAARLLSELQEQDPCIYGGEGDDG